MRLSLEWYQRGGGRRLVFLLERRGVSGIRRGMAPKTQQSIEFISQLITLQMKGRWESNISVWIPFMYSQKWNCATSLFPTQNYNILSPNSYTHISARGLYLSRMGPSILLQPNMLTDPGNIKISHRHMNVGIGSAAQFLFQEYINSIFGTVNTFSRLSDH